MADLKAQSVTSSSSRAPAKLIQYLKGRSSRMLQDEFPQLRKRYWGTALVGAVDQETIRRSIEDQKCDEPGENFKITAPTEP